MNSAVRSEPKCIYPVGDGAKRVRAGTVGNLCEALRCGAAPCWVLEETAFDNARQKRDSQNLLVHTKPSAMSIARKTIEVKEKRIAMSVA